MITNATITNPGGASNVILTSDLANLNAATYGNITGYQYQVDTSALPNGGDATTWQTYTIDFTATSSSILLTLADDPISTNSNISIASISLATVPEPKDWAVLMFLGVGLLVAVRKARAGLIS